MNRAFVFPGQGSQAVGMGKELAESFPVAREVFDEVDEALGQKLSDLMFDGSPEDLTLTENAQPAIMATSMAVMRVLEAEGGIDIGSNCRFVAGHSLGEYTALTAAGALSVADAAKLLRLRGRAMQEAVPVGKGAMAAMMVDLEQAKDIAVEAAQGEVCAPANDNAPGQVVLSGALKAIKRALSIAAMRGARCSVLLPVSAPFHCELMLPAADKVKAALSDVAFNNPVVPLISNVTARPVERAEELRGLLVEQITGMVRWRESVHVMLENGVNSIVEIGSSTVLSGLARRIDRGMASVSVGTPAQIDDFIKTL